MNPVMPFILPAASAQAHQWNWLFLALLLLSGAVSILVASLITIFAIRYRRGAVIDRSNRKTRTSPWEIGWSVASFAAFMVLFAWGADLFVQLKTPPDDAQQIFVIGKQWMWKIQHPGGQREINTLHLPVDRPVKLILASEDVIHSFHLPAFRITQDAVPGRFESLWFTPDRIGTYHLFCSEFCGTDHADMGGSVIVMTQPDYESWLTEERPQATLAADGEKLFRAYGCSNCHGLSGAGPEGSIRAPALVGLYGRPVPLADGRTVAADDRYLRDSILQPQSEIVAGFAPIMPSFAGQISEDEMVLLIAYLESLGSLPAAQP